MLPWRMMVCRECSFASFIFMLSRLPCHPCVICSTWTSKKSKNLDREGKYGQDVFTLRSTYSEGRPPPVHIHWRRFRVADIPLETLEGFDGWLRDRWDEKDELLAEHARTGRFASDIDGTPIATKVKLGHWTEIWSIGGVLALVAAGVVTLQWMIGWFSRK